MEQSNQQELLAVREDMAAEKLEEE